MTPPARVDIFPGCTCGCTSLLSLRKFSCFCLMSGLLSPTMIYDETQPALPDSPPPRSFLPHHPFSPFPFNQCFFCRVLPSHYRLFLFLSPGTVIFFPLVFSMTSPVLTSPFNFFLPLPQCSCDVWSLLLLMMSPLLLILLPNVIL